MEPGLPISSAARQLGIDPATLRAWQRRYGLGASSRSPGGHRRYTGEDLARLRSARDLIAAGMSTADAAQAVLARDWASFASGQPRTHSRHAAQPRVDFLPDAYTRAESPIRTSTSAVAPAAEPRAADLALFIEAALNLDGALLASLLTAHLAHNGSYQSWETLLRPALRIVDSCDARRPQRIAAEHLLSQLASAALLNRAATYETRAHTDTPRPHRRTRTAGRVVLACTPTEQHTLPLLALSATLAEAGIPTLMLGARTPIEVLNLLANTGMAAQGQQIIVVLAVRRAAANAALLAPSHSRLTWIAAGPGWEPHALPADVQHANGLAATIELIHRALSDDGQGDSVTDVN